MEYALVLSWFVALQALAFVAVPLAVRLFPGFPDRGAAFALPVALVVVTGVGYWVGHVAFGRWTAFFAVAVLAGLSAVALWRDHQRGEFGLSDAAIRGYLEAAIVFAVAFGFLVAVRAVDPSIHPGGGEKFLDFGILKSILRAEALPPKDMWWVGDHVLYYYGGHLASALLAHLTGTGGKFAYNLALSGFYAMLVTAAYGLAGALADARGASRRIGGAFGAFFVGFSSNLVTPVAGAIWLLPDSIASGVANWVAKPIADSSSGEFLTEGIESFGYWAPSRVVPGTINEFPLFSFLNGDLHAHMVSTPFTLLVAALGFAYVRSDALGRRRALAFGVVPFVVGLLGLVNVWSFPTGLGVVWLALVFAPTDPLTLFSGTSADETTESVADGGTHDVQAALLAELRRVVSAFVVTGLVGVLAIAWVAPFVFDVLLQSTSNRSLAVFPKPSSAIGLLLVHGTFLAVFAAFLWPRTRSAFDVNPARFAALTAGLVGASWLVGYPVLVLVVPLLVGSWLLLRTREGDWGYETVLILAGAGLVTLVEFVYVQDGAIGGRFNTVFKVYMQVWVLWATAAGGVLATLLASTELPDASARRKVASALVLVLVVSSGLYGGFALDNHFTSPYNRVDDPTLDGRAYVADHHPEEAAAIAWLNDREGQPNIVSPAGEKPYTWTSPASSLTGLPTVVGWVHHEGVYRGHETSRRRATDVTLVYNGQWADRAELLDEYDVTYVYVGPRARERYDADDLDFSTYPGIEVAFSEDGVVVYRVDQSKI